MGRSKVAGRPCKKCGYREGLDPAPFTRERLGELGRLGSQIEDGSIEASVPTGRPKADAPEAPPVFEIARLEGILSLQQGAFDQLFQELDEMEGGFLARVKRIVSRHSGKYYKERKPCG